MKRVFIVILMFILFSNFVLAQNNLNDNLGEINVSSSGIREKTNEALAKEIQIPENWQFLARVVFGLKSGQEINLQLFIILVGLWVIVLLLVVSILNVTPFFEGAKSWIGGVAVTLLIALSGGLKLAASFILSLSNLFGLLEKWGLFTLLLGLVLLVVVYFLFSKVIKLVKTQTRIAEAEKAGQDIGFARAVGKSMRENMEE